MGAGSERPSSPLLPLRASEISSRKVWHEEAYMAPQGPWKGSVKVIWEPGPKSVPEAENPVLPAPTRQSVLPLLPARTATLPAHQACPHSIHTTRPTRGLLHPIPPRPDHACPSQCLCAAAAPRCGGALVHAANSAAQLHTIRVTPYKCPPFRLPKAPSPTHSWRAVLGTPQCRTHLDINVHQCPLTPVCL